MAFQIRLNRRVCWFGLVALAGCANLQTVHHQFEYNGGDSPPSKLRAVSVDANQRFLVSNYNKLRSQDPELWRACAEPSPDAMAVFGGSLAGGLTKDSTSAQLAAGFAAQAASIGLRTQSITLLRDAQYRLCEAYINGALDGRQLAALHRRFQNIMVANLAIEQLTGYARPTVTQVGAGGAASVAGGLAEAQKALDDANKDLTKKQSAAADAKTKVDETTTAYNAKKAATASARAALPTGAVTAREAATKQKKTADELQEDANAKLTAALIAEANGGGNARELRASADAATTKADKATASADALKKKADALNKPADDAQKEEDDAKAAMDTAAKAQKNADTAVADAKENITALEAARDAARGMTASGTVASGSTVVSPAPSPASSAQISAAVLAIVQSVLDENYTDDTCMDYLTTPPPDSAGTFQYVMAMCVARAMASAESKEGISKSVALGHALQTPYVKSIMLNQNPSFMGQLQQQQQQIQQLKEQLQKQQQPPAG